MKRAKLTPDQRAYFDWELKNSHAVTAFEVVGPYTLHLTFDDGKQSTIDFESALRGIYRTPMFEPMLDPDYFAQVSIDDTGVLTWPNGTDFNPAQIYDWDNFIVLFQAANQSLAEGSMPSIPE